MNVDGYYNILLTLFDKGVEEGFIENSATAVSVGQPCPSLCFPVLVTRYALANLIKLTKHYVEHNCNIYKNFKFWSQK